MTSKNHRNEMTGAMTDAELNCVTGGDKATTTKGATRPTPPVKYMTYTMEQVLISSY